MNDRNTLSLVIVGLLSIATMVTGTYGWMQPEAGGNIGLGEALYRAFLAFSGGNDYLTATSWSLKIARTCGALTTAAVFIAILVLFLSRWLTSAIVTTRENHVVLVGVNDFSLSYARQRAGSFTPLTLLDDPEALDAHPISVMDSDVIALPVDLGNSDDLVAGLGAAPRTVILGSPDSVTNIERATAILNKRPETPLVIRSEKENVTASLNLWNAPFKSLPIVSHNAYVARALVTELAPLELARLRGHRAPHIGIVGVSDTGLAIIEELALRCHAPDLRTLKISTFDLDAPNAQLKLRMERGGLLNAVDLALPQPLDGLSCGIDPDKPDALAKAAATPLTAIIVCTGEDEINFQIALRLRRLQSEQGLFDAPIMARLRGGQSTAPAPVTNIASGIYTFGGTQLSDDDLALEALQDAQGRRLHDIWHAEMAARDPDGYYPEWDDLDAAGKRTNWRAALSAIEMFQTLGFVAPRPNGFASLSVDPDAVAEVLDQPEVLNDLARSEHDRWVAERFSEGWSQSPDGKRDNKRKIHTLMVPFDKLPAGQQEEKKDHNNVRAILKDSAARARTVPVARRWRKRLRIGIMGPIHLPDIPTGALEAQILGWMDKAPVPLKERHLEVITPNAPGFDRIGAKALMTVWNARFGRPADLFCLEVEPADALDRHALAHLGASNGFDDTTNLKTVRAQSAALDKAAVSRRRELQTAPFDMPDADFLVETEAAATRMAALSDIFMVYMPDGMADMTWRVAEGFADRKGEDRIIRITL